jgi:hypothetical protein
MYKIGFIYDKNIEELKEYVQEFLSDYEEVSTGSIICALMIKNILTDQQCID